MAEGTIRTSEAAAEAAAAFIKLSELVDADAKATISADSALHTTDDLRARAYAHILWVPIARMWTLFATCGCHSPVLPSRDLVLCQPLPGE